MAPSVRRCVFVFGPHRLCSWQLTCIMPCNGWWHTDMIVLCCHAVNVYLPKDRVTNQHQGYGFVEFRTEDDADYVSPCCGDVQREWLSTYSLCNHLLAASMPAVPHTSSFTGHSIDDGLFL